MSSGKSNQPIHQFVAKKIKEARRHARLSQRALSQKLGVSDKTVSSWEVGRAEPSLQMLFDIGDTTHKPIEFFLKDEDYSISSKLMLIEKELQKIRQLLNETQTNSSQKKMPSYHRPSLKL